MIYIPAGQTVNGFAQSLHTTIYQFNYQEQPKNDLCSEAAIFPINMSEKPNLRKIHFPHGSFS